MTRGASDMLTTSPLLTHLNHSVAEFIKQECRAASEPVHGVLYKVGKARRAAACMYSVCTRHCLLGTGGRHISIVVVAVQENILTTTTPPIVVCFYFVTAMQFRVPALLAAVLAALSIRSVGAMPSDTEALVAHSPDGIVSLTAQSGCGSAGPLGSGGCNWYILVSCTPGDAKFVVFIFGDGCKVSDIALDRTCEATDATGCFPGDAANIATMHVYSSDGSVQYALESQSNSVPFICPSGGRVRCQADFKGITDSPNYSLRVF
ncbi:hypothetical protein BDW22DRAFT_1357566 [Trametopsis cervina]|nr:hypothetical protein BDW22DRAFT_1357566 [Trametopsis cervina]